MTRNALRLTGILLILVLAGASTGNAQDTGWSLRINGTFTDPDRRSVVADADGNDVETVTSEAVGLALSGEYRFSDRIGLELGIQAGYEADVAVTVTDENGLQNDGLTLPEDGLRFTLVDVALNIYLVSGGVDLYIGPVLGFITYDDMAFRVGAPWVPVEVRVDGGLALGAVLGLDIPCGDAGWFFTTSLKYLDSAYDVGAEALGTGKQEIDFDPLIVRAGFGYRF